MSVPFDEPTDTPSGQAGRGRRWIRSWKAVVGAVVTVVAVATAVTVEPGVIHLYRKSSRPAATACAGSPRPTVLAVSPGHLNVLKAAADRWNAVHASGGRCGVVTVMPRQPSQLAAALGAGWDTTRDGPLPAVWVPDSSLWLDVATIRPEAARILAHRPSSIASSPVVLAVRRPVAEALGWPAHPLTSTEVFGAFAAAATGGQQQPTAFRIGLTDPAASTAGLASVLTTMDPAATGTVTDEQLLNSIRFSQLAGAVAPDTSTFFDAQTTPATGQQPQIAAWPALERDVAAYDADHPASTVIPVYQPRPVVADYPYAELTAPWVDARQHAVADAFLNYLLSPGARDLFASQGLREPDGSVHDAGKLPANQGFRADFGPPRPTPDPQALSRIIGQWSAMQRPANVLVVLDTSGSMNEPVPGTGVSKLQLLKQTALAGFGLLTNQTSIGLWDFSMSAGRPGEYRQLVPFGPIAGQVGTAPRRRALLGATGALRAGGFTPLYDSAYAAFHEMQNDWRPNCTNVVLLVTDGAEEMPNGPALSEVVQRLRQEQRTDKPIQLIAIAVGSQADAASLQALTAATGGRVFLARDPAKAVQNLILAFAGRLN